MKKLLIILLIGFLFSCNKDKDKEPNPFSYWKIDGIEYASNKIDTAVGKKVAGMTCGDLNLRYNLRYFLPYFPTSGEWLIVRGNISQNPNWVDMNFYL